MFCSSQAIASRRSSVQDVADHASALTPPSSASSRWASSAHRMPTPESRIFALGRTLLPEFMP